IIASGTYSESTLENLKLYTKLKQIVNYSTEEAIKDGIISNFNVYIYLFKLNNTKSVQFGTTKKWYSTDVKECLRLSKKIARSEGKEKMITAIFRMKMINSCQSLVTNVKQWI